MKWMRVAAITLVVAVLGMGGWYLFLRPKETNAVPTAPGFVATLYGRTDKVTVPQDYAGNWVWLMFSGKD